MSNTLHYPGDRTNFDPDQIMGPDLHGAFYRPIAAEYDDTTDRTTMQFKPLSPADLAEALSNRADR